MKLRLINLSGAVLFAIYGVFIHSLPVITLNSGTALLNLFHLNKLRRRKDRFEILEARSVDEPLMQKFMNYYREDIIQFFGVPDFKVNDDYLSCYILRNMVPAGIFIGRVVGEDQEQKSKVLEILIDYVTPEFRDMKNSQFLFYKNSDWLKKHRISEFRMTTSVSTHQQYLQKIGFENIDPQKNPPEYRLKRPQ